MRIRELPEAEIEDMLNEHLALKEQLVELWKHGEELSEEAQRLHDAFIWANVAYRAAEDESGRCRGLFTRLKEMKQERLDQQRELILQEENLSLRIAVIEFHWKRDPSRWSKIRRRLDDEY